MMNIRTKKTIQITAETRDAYDKGVAARPLTCMQQCDRASEMRNDDRRRAFLLGAWGSIDTIEGAEYLRLVPAL